MNFEYIEKIVKLFERNQSLNKPLELNINEDLLKILPLQRKFLLTLLRQSPISNFSCLSQDETVLVFQNQVDFIFNFRKTIFIENDFLAFSL